MIFRRPELEKDNPIAPEPYIGPRRRLAMARAASSGKPAEVDDVKETLQALTTAASCFMDSEGRLMRGNDVLCKPPAGYGTLPTSMEEIH